MARNLLRSYYVPLATADIENLPPMGHARVGLRIANEFREMQPLMLQPEVNEPRFTTYIEISIDTECETFDRFLGEALKTDAGIQAAKSAFRNARRAVKNALDANQRHNNDPRLKKTWSDLQEAKEELAKAVDSSEMKNALEAKIQALQAEHRELLKLPQPHTSDEIAALDEAVNQQKDALEKIRGETDTLENRVIWLAQYLHERSVPQFPVLNIRHAICNGSMKFYELEQTDENFELGIFGIRGAGRQNKIHFPLDILAKAISGGRAREVRYHGQEPWFVFAPLVEKDGPIGIENMRNVIIGNTRAGWACLLSQTVLYSLALTDDDLRTSPVFAWITERTPHPSHEGWARNGVNGVTPNGNGRP